MGFLQMYEEKGKTIRRTEMFFVQFSKKSSIHTKVSKFFHWMSPSRHRNPSAAKPGKKEKQKSVREKENSTVKE
eukprot:c42848_g1_i1 orf=3-224(+)